MAKTFVHFELRRDLAIDWAGDNPILLEGEPGWEIDTNRLKFGDGFTAWNSLPYFGSQDLEASQGSILFGRGDSGPGDVEELTIGSGLSITGTTLSAQTRPESVFYTADHTLTLSDNTKVVVMNSATPVNVTIPLSLLSGFNCLVLQEGAGQVTFVADGTTLNSADGYLKLRTQYSGCSIVAYDDNVFSITGDLAA